VAATGALDSPASSSSPLDEFFNGVHLHHRSWPGHPWFAFDFRGGAFASDMEGAAFVAMEHVGLEAIAIALVDLAAGDLRCGSIHILALAGFARQENIVHLCLSIALMIAGFSGPVHANSAAVVATMAINHSAAAQLLISSCARRAAR